MVSRNNPDNDLNTIAFRLLLMTNSMAELVDGVEDSQTLRDEIMSFQRSAIENYHLISDEVALQCMKSHCRALIEVLIPTLALLAERDDVFAENLAKETASMIQQILGD